ncbi:MAG: tetratricopeptide repeat protein, partial [Bdellovibrionales bacterium]|nr:tetratricopeptide repeat protein [Bdellovibrionales bacterium]
MLRFASWAGGLILLLLCACALPPKSDTANISVVPTRELQAVSLGTEGISFSKRGRLLEAEFRFRQALYLFPDAVNLKVNLGVVLEKQGRFEEALAIYQDLSAAEPDSINFKGSVAKLYFQAGMFQRAREQFTSAINDGLALLDRPSVEVTSDLSRPTPPEIRKQISRLARSLSVLEFTLGNEQEALCYSLFASTLSSEPDEVARHAKLLNALNLSQQAIEAIESFKASHALRNNSEILFQLAVASAAQDKLTDAHEMSTLALEAKKVDPNVKFEALLLQEITVDYAEEALIRKEIAKKSLKLDVDLDEVEDEESEEDEESYSAIEDPRLSDPEIVDKLALYWPYEFEELFYAKYDDYLKKKEELDKAKEGFWSNALK